MRPQNTRHPTRTHPDTKDKCEIMSPNTVTDCHSFSTRMTVAQRKQANELRKTLKPLMEKRRRARINESLNKLKALIVPLVSKDTTRYSKLEKADVLEMTVRFLRDLPSSPIKGQTESYKEGYRACLQRVSALLPRSRLDSETFQRVDEFIQQSLLSSSSPACQNCCGQSSKTFPQIHQRLLSMKSSVSKTEKPAAVTGPSSAGLQPALQITSANMWRPW